MRGPISGLLYHRCFSNSQALLGMDLVGTFCHYLYQVVGVPPAEELGSSSAYLSPRGWILVYLSPGMITPFSPFPIVSSFPTEISTDWEILWWRNWSLHNLQRTLYFVSLSDFSAVLGSPQAHSNLSKNLASTPLYFTFVLFCFVFHSHQVKCLSVPTPFFAGPLLPLQCSLTAHMHHLPQALRNVLGPSYLRMQ